MRRHSFYFVLVLGLMIAPAIRAEEHANGPVARGIFGHPVESGDPLSGGASTVQAALEAHGFHPQNLVLSRSANPLYLGANGLGYVSQLWRKIRWKFYPVQFVEGRFAYSCMAGFGTESGRSYLKLEACHVHDKRYADAIVYETQGDLSQSREQRVASALRWAGLAPEHLKLDQTLRPLSLLGNIAERIRPTGNFNQHLEFQSGGRAYSCTVSLSTPSGAVIVDRCSVGSAGSQSRIGGVLIDAMPTMP